MKFKLAILSLLITTSSHAGMNGLTHHSRANCAGFNESVSWDYTHGWTTWVRSEHILARSGIVDHMIFSGWVTHWRNAQYHWPEGGAGWIVHGTHWMPWNGQAYVAAEEYTDNCSQYDGWWL